MSSEHRGGWHPSYHLIAIENRHASRLPGLPPDTEAWLLTTPRGRGTVWGEYLVRLPAGSESSTLDQGLEHFVYLLDGEVEVSGTGLEGTGAFAYLPPGEGLTLRSQGGAELLWVKRPYEPLPGVDPPGPLSGTREAAEVHEDPSWPGAYERRLLPVEDLSFDLAMNLLAFDPGVEFFQVEIHDEDHGIWFTQGGGTYLMDRDRFEVRAGDYMYLGPYCPQHFVVGGELSEYLLYKPVNRDGFGA